MMKNILYFVLIVISLLSISCSKNISDNTSEMIEYDKLFSRYGWENVENVKDKSVAKNLKAIASLEELEDVLKYIQNMKSENIETLVSEQFDMLPRLKSTNESGGQRIVKISGSNSDGRVDVFLDISVPAVTNSAFYNTGLWDAFIGYNHLSGSAYKSGNKINFTANGEIILKIIWQGIELKRLPTSSTGYYDTNSGQGQITNM